MWLFDLIEEEKISTDSSQTTWTWSGTTAWDDSSFLIIEDTNNAAETPIVSEINAADIPDTAISFFDDTAVTDEKNDVILETWAPVVTFESEASTTEENSLFASSDLSENNINNSANIDNINQTSDLFSSGTLINEPVSAPIFDVMESSIDNVSLTTDPNSILDSAITELEKLSQTYDSKIDDNLKRVEEINSQISSLKEEAKKHTDEAKKTWVEKEKVAKMIDTFKSQKI